MRPRSRNTVLGPAFLALFATTAAGLVVNPIVPAFGLNRVARLGP